METHAHTLKVKSLGIDSYRENIIFMRADCHICRSEGFTALTRLIVSYRDKSIIATLNVVYSDMIAYNQAGLSMEAMKRLNVNEGDSVAIAHLKPIESLGKVRAKMYGKALSETDFDEIIDDVVDGKYSNIELAAFITACTGKNLSVEEIIYLTKAMIRTGKKLDWNTPIVLDKHCVGGLPGNRTTPIVVSIIAAAGLIIPKTSSKAITSPAGTADTMEVMTNVDLDLEQMKKVVEQEQGCMSWGGSVQLSPADDILIAVEKALDVDSEGQMIASVLSKKAAAGATHVLIDIPMGKTAKVRSHEEALRLQYYFKAVGESIGLEITVLITDGSQPVGRGIGPSLEAMDVLEVLRNDATQPMDLKNHALVLSAELLEISGKYEKGQGHVVAKEILESGRAYTKFMAICKAQGGFTEPQLAPFRFDYISTRSGVVKEIDNRKLARVAKLAGAPKTQGAGVLFTAPIGAHISSSDALFSIYAGVQGELEYAKDYLRVNQNLIIIE